MFHVGIFTPAKCALIYNSTLHDTTALKMDFDENELSEQEATFFNNLHEENVVANGLIKLIQKDFDEIKSKIHGELGYACVVLMTSVSEQRKAFIYLGLKCGFKKVEIIDIFTSCYLFATFRSPYTPQNGEIIWIISNKTCNIWQKSNGVSEHINSFSGKFEENEVVLKFLENAKPAFRPKAILFIDNHNRSHISKLSAKYNCFIHQFSTNHQNKNGFGLKEGSIIYARQMANDPVVAEYNVTKIMERFFVIKTKNTKHSEKEKILKLSHRIPFKWLIKVLSSQLPLKLTISSEIPFTQFPIILENKDNDTNLENMEYETTIVDSPNSKEMLLVLNVDSNGIFESSLKTFMPNLFENTDKYIKCMDFTPRIEYIIPKWTTNDPEINVAGIDWGTTNSCAAVNRKFGMVTIGLENTGDRSLQSYVSYAEEKEMVGQKVVDRMRYQADASVFDLKNIIGKTNRTVELGKNWTFNIAEFDKKAKIKVESYNGSIEKRPEEIAAALLSHIKQELEKYQGKKLNSAVITVPAEFDQNQKQAIYDSALMAEWKVIQLLPEPVAAAFAYFIKHPISNNTTSFLFDLGGGTMDVCIFEVKNNQLQILQTSGDRNLGGRDFDNLLIDYYEKKLNDAFDIFLTGKQRFKLMSKCQAIKETLSNSMTDDLAVEDFNPLKESFISMTRENFEKLSAELLIKIQLNIEMALKNAGFSAIQMKKIFYVGGCCRMPMIKKLLHKIFPLAEHCCEKHPDEVVAVGAAYYSYYLNTTSQSTLASEKGYFFPKEVLINDDNVAVVGIDLGTSRCCAAVNRKDGILTAALDNTGERLLPSYVSFDEEKVKCGNVVVSRMQNYATSTVFDFKKILGKTLGMVNPDKSWSYDIADIDNNAKIQVKSYDGQIVKSPEEIAAKMFEHIKKQAELFQGKIMKDVVIAVPAIFDETQRTGIRTAALLAGWENINLLPETVAVAFSFFIQHPVPNNATLLIFDLGGGMLNICISEIQETKLKIISNTGSANLGGRNFDNLLFEYFKAKLFHNFNFSIPKMIEHIFMRECVKIKENLSFLDKDKLELYHFNNSFDNEVIEITRKDFETMSTELIYEIEEIIKIALQTVNYRPEKIDKILVAGGCCHMPMIRTL